MIVSGIVDQAKVTGTALANAASVASVVLTAESLVADIPEENRLHRQCLTAWRYVLIPIQTGKQAMEAVSFQFCIFCKFGQTPPHIINRY